MEITKQVLLLAVLVSILLLGCVQSQPQPPAQQPVPNATPPEQAPAQPPQPPAPPTNITTVPNATGPVPPNATPAPETAGPFGSMLAYNINDGLMRTPGLTDTLQREGWAGFRTDAASYQALKNAFGQVSKERTALLKNAGFGVDREIAEYFTWNVIEPRKGEFDWNLTDALVTEADRAGVKLSAVVQPFAAWDKTDMMANPGCHALDFAYYDYKAGPPNDWDAYKNFLTRMVERYRGRVAYWEIGNEVEGPCGGFENNSEGYVKLLNVSYQTIKAADPQAKVINGGALEVVGNRDAEAVKSFWRKFFELGGGQYTDYFNFHYNIEKSGGAKPDSSAFLEHLNFFNGLMDKNGGRKPVWITEFGTYSGTPSQQPLPLSSGGQQGQQQPGGADENRCGDGYCNEIERTSGGCPQDCGGQSQQSPPQQQPGSPPAQAQGQGLPTQSQEFQAAWYFRNSIIGFANGADRIFIDLVGADNQTVGASAAFNANGEPRLFLTTLKTISAKIGGFSKAEKISEGQYKFTVSNKSVYALWSGTLPKEISGQVKVTDFEGLEKTVDASEIKLQQDRPVFAEPASQNTASPAAPSAQNITPSQAPPNTALPAPAPLEIKVPATDPFNDPNGPYYHKVYSATSKDGLNWQSDGAIVFDYASVPGAVLRHDNTLLVYYVDGTMTSTSGVVVAKSNDLGKSWVKYGVVLENLENPLIGKACSADPEPVELGNGTLRLYLICFLFGNGGPSGTEVISALSENGIVFNVENGVRAKSQPGETLTDPDVLKMGNAWKMYLSQGMSVVSLTSPDGLNFTRDPGYRNTIGAVTNSLIFADGKARHYFCGQDGIMSARSEGGDWSAESGIRVSRGSAKMICDPNVVELPDGTYKMFYKTQT